MVEAVGSQAEVWVDTGIMTGADIVAAIALGARIALVGRAYLYGLMAGGERGVDRAAEILSAEVRRTMQLLGVAQHRRARTAARTTALTGLETGPAMADTLDVIEFTPTADQLAYTFGGVAPIRRITPGTVLRLWSEDAFGGVLRSVHDLSSEKVDLRFVNPQTGPFYVDGAEPGDALALHFVSVEPARDWAASATIPFFGGLTSTDRTATLQDPLPDTTWIYQLDRARGTLRFEARHGEFAVDLPLAPMLGTVGVAPAGNEVRSSLVPGPVRRQHGHPADARRHDLLPRRERRGRSVLDRRRALPPGRGRVVRDRSRGRHDHDADRRSGQGRRARVAAPRGRRVPDDGRLQPSAGGRVAGLAGRDGHLAGRAVRAGQDGRLPTAVADLRGADSRTSSTPTTAWSPRRASHCYLPPTRSVDCIATFGHVPLESADSKGLLSWTCNCPGCMRWSPAAPAASAGRSSRPSSPRVPPSRSAPGMPTRSRPRRTRCRSSVAAVLGTALDVADADALTAWVTGSAELLGGIDIIVSNVSALAIEDKPENWTASFEVDLMAHGAHGERGNAVSRGQPGARPSSRCPACPAREIDFAAGPYGTIKAALIHYMQGLAHQLADKGHPRQRSLAGEHLLRGRRVVESSSRTCPTCSRPRWH